MPLSHRLFRALPALALAASSGVAGVASAADIHGTVHLVPGAQTAPGVWVSAVRTGDFLLTSASSARKGASSLRYAVTDPRGEFTFRGLDPGEYEVSVRADSLPPTLAAEGQSVSAVLVSPEDDAKVDLQVTRLARFEGMARRQGGGALTGVRVQAYHKGDNTPFAETWTGSKGEFRFTGLERNVPVDVLVTTKEGQYRKLTKAPARAGPQAVEVVLPPWSPATKRRVILNVILPTVGERRYELDWISRPEEAVEGFRTTVSLDRDGRGELESPGGMFLVRVRETGPGGSVWTAPRFFRVVAGTGPITARVDLNADL